MRWDLSCWAKHTVTDQQPRNLAEMNKDRREQKRYIFSKEENATMMVSVNGSQRSIENSLLNVSEGGMGLAADKGVAQDIEVGSELHVVSLKGAPDLQRLQKVSLSVRWITKHEAFDHLCIGCEFCNLPEEARMEIVALVEKAYYSESIVSSSPGNKEMGLGDQATG